MMLEWFNAREAAEVGTALADQFAPRQRSCARAQSRQRRCEQRASGVAARADREVRTLQLNFYKKARFANSFKWRLIENGVERRIADEVTQSLILHLSQRSGGCAAGPEARRPRRQIGPPRQDRQLFSPRAINALPGALMRRPSPYIRSSSRSIPRHADALNNLEWLFAIWVAIKRQSSAFVRRSTSSPDYADALCNLGNLLRCKGTIRLKLNRGCGAPSS